MNLLKIVPMKTRTILLPAAFALVLTAVSSCYDLSDIWDKLDELDLRLTKVEQKVERMNANISSLQELVTALQNKDFVTDLVYLSNNAGYKFVFASGKTVTVYNGTDGSDGHSPKISVKPDTDGEWYWTIDGAWLLVGGQKVKAVGSDGNDGHDGKDGVTPQLKIVDGYWYVSYDGQSWTMLGPATGEGSGESDNLIKSIQVKDGYVIIILNDGANTELRLKLATGEEGGDPQPSAWVIEYKGREKYTDDNGYVSDVERFHVEAPGAAYYLVRTINPDVFRENYGTDVLAFFRDEQHYLEQDAEYNNEKVTDYLYSESPQDLLFDRIRHGDWDGYLIGFDARGKVTGEYAKCSFTIQEEVPTAAFQKWLGKWTVSSGGISYDVVVSSSEANFAYYIDGWETGDSIDSETGTIMDGDRDWFETYFEPSNGAMYFTSQYIQTYEEDGSTYDQYFYGNIYYNGRLVEKGEYVITEEGFDIAAATLTNDGGTRGQVSGCGINVYMTDSDSSLYETTFTSMQYYAFRDGNDLLKFNLNIPQFPLTMVKKSSATSSVSRPMARKIATPRALREHTRLRDVQRNGRAHGPVTDSRRPVAQKAQTVRIARRAR